MIIKKNFIMILSLLIIPLIGVLLLLPLEVGAKPILNTKVLSAAPGSSLFKNFIEGWFNTAHPGDLMKKIALFTSLLNLLISIYMWFQFDNSSMNYQFVSEFNSLNFCHFHVGVDGISLYFVVRPLTINTNLELSRFALLFLNFLFLFISYITLPWLRHSRVRVILSTC